jgi:hypothetical protein
VSAAKYCAHHSAVEFCLAHHGDDTAVAARDLGRGHVEGKEFTQKPSGSVSIERKADLFVLIHGRLAPSR